MISVIDCKIFRFCVSSMLLCLPEVHWVGFLVLSGDAFFLVCEKPTLQKF